MDLELSRTLLMTNALCLELVRLKLHVVNACTVLPRQEYQERSSLVSMHLQMLCLLFLELWRRILDLMLKTL